MNFYDRHIAPALINLACGVKPVAKQRGKIVPRARGTVLEVGFGSGHNIPYYDPGKVTRVIALEPSPEMRKRAAKRIAQSPIALEFVDLPGEQIPLESASVDTVMITYTMCSIDDVEAALAQMRRVLKPDGELLFCEHGRAPDQGIARWQDRLTPAWRRIGGGCRLNRNIPELVRRASFTITELEEMYLPGTPRVLGYNYWGAAR